MNLAQLVEQWERDPRVAACLTTSRRLPPRPARHAPWPAALDPRLVAALRRRGIEASYTHQAQAIEAALAGRNVVVVTPTASGKTLCYNVPVLDRLLREPSARALYLFPTKALAQDQLAELHAWAAALPVPLRAYTYDGDTPATARQAVRAAGSLVVTNPDMLHTAMLPHHTRWTHLFSQLRYVIVDELHTYRGVFGSHLANVLRRLKRTAAFYGARPQFLLASATIANPRDLAEQLIEEPVELVDDNGAPQGPRHFLFYNPPAIDTSLGVRRSAVLAARDLAGELLRNQVQTIVFARSRLTVELLVTYLKGALRGPAADAVRGYRGGYLPSERRSIEAGLRGGAVRGVVATNALELGIDVGGLDACVLVGYPGTVASTWQQAGRAGRRNDLTLTALVATSSPLDQFIVTHPEYLFDRSVEAGLVNPNNLYIRTSHLKCAAFEEPFADGESFGGDATEQLLAYLEEERVLHHQDGRWYWMAEAFPAEAVSLRSAAIDNFVIVDVSETAKPRVIGEMDRMSVPTLLHEEAIYLHEGQQFQVERLDWSEKKAFVRAVAVDYYTDAELVDHLQPLEVIDQGEGATGTRAWGEVALTFRATIFKKIKLHTHENVGWGKIQLPEETHHTTAYWFTLADGVVPDLSTEDVEAGLVGLAHVLGQLAPLYLMCDPRDLGARAEARSPFTRAPTVYIYERLAGGVGLAEKLYAVHADLHQAAAAHVAACPCAAGCPSCVGPSGGPPGSPPPSPTPRLTKKHAARRLLRALLREAVDAG
ncbi:MAG TPA: DEAD/DEAH box helicase [Chloroflexota bacterium]|jgi:DEAD/DEAH box helicase domain-containing protein